MKIIGRIALAFTVFGAINWGCVGLLGFDMISLISGGPNTGLARIIYAAVGLCGVWATSFFFKERNVTDAAESDCTNGYFKNR